MLKPSPGNRPITSFEIFGGPTACGVFPASTLKFDPEGTPADETVNDLVDVAELVLPVRTPLKHFELLDVSRFRFSRAHVSQKSFDHRRRTPLPGEATHD